MEKLVATFLQSFTTAETSRKNEHQQVANEESFLISKDVHKKWEQVALEYSLKL